jgi:photosystem II stability/assembly factor-like uncharacterized protein/subtilisin-like proprotein convertase family protein
MLELNIRLSRRSVLKVLLFFTVLLPGLLAVPAQPSGVAAQPGVTQAQSVLPNFAGVYTATWQFLGPTNMGGRVRTLVTHPTDPAIMWAGTSGGGIWKTTDGGANWFPLNDFLPNMSVSTLIIDPTNPDVLWAGTGEGFFNPDAIQGAGIFKTTNGGQTWAQLASTANANFFYVNRLAISPSGSTLLAATRTGIYRSSDGGATWVQALNSGAASVMDIDFDPTGGVPVASTKAIASGDFGSVWVSTNGGVSWTLADTTGAGTNAFIRIEVAHAPQNPNIVYASVNKNGGEIWKSTNSGGSYSLVSTGFNFLTPQQRYSNALWVDPTNSDIVIVGGTYLWRSTDGGVTFSQISDNANGLGVPQANQHFIVQQPGFNGTGNTAVFFTNDGGIFKTANVYTVTSTLGWQALNNGLAVTQFYAGAGNPSSGVIVGGSQALGTLRYKGEADNWQALRGSNAVTDSVAVTADPTDPNYLYGQAPYMAVYRSKDGGATTEYIYAGITDALNSFSANYQAPMLLDPNNPNTLLVGGRSLWRSPNVKDNAPTWSAIRAPFGSCISQCITAIAIAKGSSDNIWIGYYNGQIYRTTNGTALNPTWIIVDNNGVTNPLPNRTITRITIDANNPNQVYVAMNGYTDNNLWRFNGSSWADISGISASGIPSVPIYAVLSHPTTPGWLYAGTDVGLYASENNGLNWQRVSPNTAPVFDIFWQDNSLIVATHGRGMWKVNLAGNRPDLRAQTPTFSDPYGNNNGVIDLNEYISVHVPLRNDGPQPATQITATLTVTSGNGTVLTNNATYPAIAHYGGTGTTTYTVLVNPTLACGDRVYFQQTVYYNGIYSYTHSFSLQTGALSPQVFGVTYKGLATSIPIPDNDPAGLEYSFNGGIYRNIKNLEVSFTITHPRTSDLAVSVVSTNGVQIRLVTNRGGNGANFKNTRFNDTAATRIWSVSAPFTGVFKPEEPLSTLTATLPSGQLKLKIVDSVSGETGQLVGASLSMEVLTYICSTVVNNPTPVTTELLPSETQAGAPGFTLSVYGSNFSPATVVLWSGTPLSTSYVNGGQLLAQVPAANLTAVGTAEITAINPSPSGGPSNPQTFTITADCRPQVVTKISDDGSCGTLRQALTYAEANAGSSISFALPLPITLILNTGALPTLSKVTTIRSSCLSTGPSVTVDGAGQSGDGLVLQEKISVLGLKIMGFGGRQLVVPDGKGAQLGCVRVGS